MFTTTNLNNEPGRYALIAEACLPVLIIWFFGYYMQVDKSSGSNIRGIPSPTAFAIIWVLIVIIWTIGLVLTAMDETSIMTVALVGSFSLVALFVCGFWLMTYGTNKVDATQALLLGTAAGVAMTVSAVCGTGPQDSTTVASLFYGLITCWFGCASLLGYLEINKI